ncbi:MAG: hypothetical protein KH812_20285 [Proteus hauseri]|jgi:hypothetical protein|nr:hypothetical protein [Proteus hauseri]DAY83208.1 MAG TPA: glycoside hydrolase family protein [Caudoviricetes sp.]
MAVKKVSVIINGVETELTYDSASGKYSKQLTAPQKSSYNINSGHYYPINVKAEDTAGNTATMNDADTTRGKLDVNESVAPVSTITAPTEGQRLVNSKPTAVWTITDNDSGVNPNTIGITIDGGSKVTAGITKTAITGGYSCSYPIPTALTEGSHVIKVDAQDYDGNNAVQRVVNIIVDTIPPQLSVTSPTNNLVTKTATLAVSGTTDDTTSKPCIVTVQLNNGTAQEIPVGSNGAFSTNITLVEGTNTIKVVSTDKAGKSTEIIRTVVLDTKAPVIGPVELSKNPVSTGETFTISVTVTD